MVDNWFPYSIIQNQGDPIELNDRQVYELSPGAQVSGIFIHFLEMISSSMNFTMIYHQRKDGGWGVPVFHDNGTMTLDPGLVKDLIDGKADMIASGLSFLLSRFSILLYSTQVNRDTFAVFISNLDVKQDFDFFVLFRPFHTQTWICIQLLLSFLSIVVCLLWESTKKNWIMYFELIARIFKLQLGSGDFSEIWNKAKVSLKVTLLVVLIMGNSFWLTYNAFLTSSLVAPIIHLPFNDLESLLASNFRCNRFLNYFPPHKH